MTQTTQKEALLKSLFDDPKREHVNIKFCRGSLSGTIDEEVFCAQVNAALFEYENNIIEAQVEPEDDLPQRDVRDLKFPA